MPTEREVKIAEELVKVINELGRCCGCDFRGEDLNERLKPYNLSVQWDENAEAYAVFQH